MIHAVFGRAEDGELEMCRVLDTPEVANTALIIVCIGFDACHKIKSVQLKNLRAMNRP